MKTATKNLMTAEQADETRIAFSGRREYILKAWMTTFESLKIEGIDKADVFNSLMFWAGRMSDCNEAEESMGFTNNYAL